MNEQLIVIGDILKSEADLKTRISLPAPKDTKIGTLVKYELRQQYLVALSDEVHGQVLVQPHNCVINLDKIQLPAQIDGQPFNAQEWIKQGDIYGIKYIGKITQEIQDIDIVDSEHGSSTVEAPPVNPEDMSRFR